MLKQWCLRVRLSWANCICQGSAHLHATCVAIEQTHAGNSGTWLLLPFGVEPGIAGRAHHDLTQGVLIIRDKFVGLLVIDMLFIKMYVWHTDKTRF